VKVGDFIHDISLEVREGEILGIWGLVGSGRTTFMRAIAGLEPTSSGSLRLRDEKIPWPKRASDAIRAGIVMVPEDRKSGLVMAMDAVQNYWLGRRKAGLAGWMPNRNRESGQVREESMFFGFNPERVGAPVKTLSGGNQQKVMLTKWAGRRPQLFLIDEPTRGIDVGAKAEVLTSLKRLAGGGAGVVMTSSELEEVLAVSHRLLVFAQGHVVAEIPRDDPRFTVEQIVRLGFKETGATDVA
jgi:ABC-type sugar transport system ATPase subunit